jgi:hypothetical protein
MISRVPAVFVMPGTPGAPRAVISKALKKFFEIAHDADGAAAESIVGMPVVVYHLLGDEKFAKFLGAQSVSYQMMVRNVILGGGFVPAETLEFSREFPESARLLLPREIVAWFSPNDLYAIRKVFSDPLALRGSKVVRAELIEKKTGQILCDLTRTTSAPAQIGRAMRFGRPIRNASPASRSTCLSSRSFIQRSAPAATAQTNVCLSARPRSFRARRAVVRQGAGAGETIRG